jgi:hypothetical protein
MSWEEEELKSEERRALVLLGTAAIIASFLAAMLSSIWAGTSKPQDFFFNIPPVGIHATYLWVNILEFSMGFWLVYALFIFFYFSKDWLSYEIRNRCRQIATAFMGAYIVFLTAFIPLIYIDVVWLNNRPEQGYFFLFALLLTAVLEWDFIKWSLEFDRLWIPGLVKKGARVVARVYRHFRPRSWSDSGPGDMPI